MTQETIYKEILLELARIGKFDENTLDHIKRKIAGAEKMPPPPSSVLVLAYHELVKTQQIPKKLEIEHLLKRRKIRTASGIAVITNLLKPYFCPGKCTYCPTEKNMPKSYLASEPAAARALRNNFDPFKQTTMRLHALKNNNHSTDKIELIIKGGTWSAYPKQYQTWFIKRCFDACNKFESHSVGTRQVTSLQNAQKINETTNNRIIGITLETRPDHINPKEIIRLRNLGCTRVELGAQILDDEILKTVKRGHTVAQLADATKLLKDAGFKVDFHIMPMLQGSTPELDLKKYKELFEDSRFRPDMVKIYPCSVVRGSLLEKLYKKGKYVPYSQKELFDLLLEMKKITPRYVRISRLIRDIPSTDVTAGSNITNLREYLQKKLHNENIRCQCLRCREIAHQLTHFPKQKLSLPILFVDSYKASDGTEYFLSFEDEERKAVYAFCRFRIPSKNSSQTIYLPELKDTALLRELHTYGYLVPIHTETNKEDAPQHTGLGRRLMEKAEEIAKIHGFQKIAVISGIGVREYYRKLGYTLERTYMVKKLC